jgi:hypothetical protein
MAWLFNAENSSQVNPAESCHDQVQMEHLMKKLEDVFDKLMV